MAKLVTNTNLQPRSSPGTYTTEALTEVIVTDVIMNDRHEYWSRLGGWDALGTIFFKSVTQRNIGYDLSTPNKVNTTAPIELSPLYLIENSSVITS